MSDQPLRQNPEGSTDAVTYTTEELNALIATVTAAQQQELTDTRASADLHANINRAVSDALGQPFGASWHDLGEKVQRLKDRADAAEARYQALRAATERLLDDYCDVVANEFPCDPETMPDVIALRAVLREPDQG